MNIKISLVTFVAFLLTVSCLTAYAEIYSWTDTQGTVHFTEDLGKVPKSIGKNIRIVEEIGQTPAEKSTTTEPSAQDRSSTSQANPSSRTGEYDPSKIYAGKTSAQWEKELMDREAAMTKVRNRIDEIAAMLNRLADNWDEQKKLLAEYKSLTDQFKEMKSQYYQQVEIARKAGLQINIQQ